jgi:hypothetical protein
MIQLQYRNVPVLGLRLLHRLLDAFISRIASPVMTDRLIVEPAFYIEFEGNLAYNGASPALQPRENSSYNAYAGLLLRY